MTSIIILLIVFTLIAVRQIGNIRLQIWQIMLLGALGVLLSRQISVGKALESINPDVMGETLTFLEFVKIGVPLTIVNVMVYGVFLMVM